MSTANNFPKLHNAMWPGLVGKGSPGAEPFIDLDTMLDLTAKAEVNGVNLTRYKLLAFGISSFYTGVHGALYAQILGHIEPQIFNVGESLTLFVAVIVGGLASVEGSILGAAFVLLVPTLLADFRELVPVVFGVAILAVLIAEPLGLYGRWLKARLYFQLWPFR